jgi:hypothetical protein
VAQPPVEDEHRPREPSGEELVIRRAPICAPSSERDEHSSAEKGEEHTDGDGHGPVIGECLLPL